MEHTCEPSVPKGLFCAECGKCLDPEGLRKVRFAGFTGPASTNPKIEAFWASGDPGVLAKPGAEDYVAV